MTRPTPAGRGGCRAGADRSPSSAVDRQICAGCRDRVEEDLVDLSELYEMCAFAVDLSDLEPGDHGQGRRGRGIPHPVVAIQAEVVRVLVSWSAVVADGRCVVAPEEPCVRRLTSFLAIHLDWLTDHPSAADFVDALDELTSAIREALRPPGQFRSSSRNEK